MSSIDPHLTVQRLVLLSLHQLRCVPHKAANTLQPIQVLLVLDLKRDIIRDLQYILYALLPTVGRYFNTDIRNVSQQYLRC